jgi:hypothetical protein
MAAALLVIVILGVSSSFSAIQRSQWMSRETQSASLAAVDKLDEIASYRYLNPNTSLISQYHGTGFDVLLGTGDMGSSDSLTSTAANFIAADATFFPASRAAQSAAVRAQAGYVEIEAVDDPLIPGDRQVGLYRVSVVVSWRTYGGDRTLVFAQLVGKD